MPGSPPIAVRCDQTGVVFPNIKNAAETMGISRTWLGIHIKDPLRRPHINGYTFTDLTYGTPPFVRKPMVGSRKGSACSIRCVQTGQVFASITEAARVMNLDPSSINKHLRGKSYRRVGGYTFKRV